MPVPDRAAALHRLLAVTLLGFASGLPLALTGQALQAWLTADGLDIAAIGFLSLVGLPYTFKFLWAPLLDRFEPPWLGRRRGWLVVVQLALAGVLLLMAGVQPRTQLPLLAALAVAVAYLSASQDIVIDAYRTELLAPSERGLGASLGVMGYRLAMIVSGGLALIWTDAAQGGGWTWGEVYRLMALLMAIAAVASLVLLPPLRPIVASAGGAAEGTAASRPAGNDLRGFAAVLAAVALGVLLTHHVAMPLAHALLDGALAATSMAPTLRTRWVELVALLAGIAVTLPLAWWAARRARFDTLVQGMRSYFAQPGAGAFLLLIVLYKLGDAFAGSLMTPFLLKAMAYAPAEVGVVNKVLGLWLTIVGALAGGAFMLRIGLWRALMVFGVLQAASNLAFWWLAVGGKGSLGTCVVPAFDAAIVKLAAATPVDGALLAAVAFENLSGGMGTAAHVALMMALCNQRFTATHYALLSAFAAIGRVWVGPLAGVLAESIGWPVFFVASTLVALPGLLLLWRLRPAVGQLDAPREAAVAD